MAAKGPLRISKGIRVSKLGSQVFVIVSCYVAPDLVERGISFEGYADLSLLTDDPKVR